MKSRYVLFSLYFSLQISTFDLTYYLPKFEMNVVEIVFIRLYTGVCRHLQINDRTYYE